MNLCQKVHHFASQPSQVGKNFPKGRGDTLDPSPRTAITNPLCPPKFRALATALVVTPEKRFMTTGDIQVCGQITLLERIYFTHGRQRCEKCHGSTQTIKKHIIPQIYGTDLSRIVNNHTTTKQCTNHEQKIQQPTVLSFLILSDTVCKFA